MSGTVVVVGSSNIDLIMKMSRLPRVGETVTDATFVQTFGGKGANQAVGAARAGGRVAFVGCVGDDAYGAQVVDALRRDAIDTRFVFAEPGVASGTALIMIGGAGQNYLSVAPGANYRLTPAHVDRARDAIAQAACVVTQCEILPATLEHVVSLAASLGKPVILNLAPARPVADATLAKLACLAVNETEAEFLTGRPVATDDDVEAAAKALLAKGPRAVLLTLGARGAYVAAEGVRALVPTFAVDAVDTTAAGDVHCGAFAVATVEGRPLLEAVRFANAAAALAVTRLGAQPSAPTRGEIEALLGELISPAVSAPRQSHCEQAAVGRRHSGLFSSSAICETPPVMHGDGSKPLAGGGGSSRELKPRAERRKLPIGRGATLLVGDRTHIVGLSDLSETGAYLVTGAAASVGDELVLQLFLLSGGSGLAVRARVVRVVPGGQEQDHHRRGLAVEFVGVDDAARARLESYVRAGLRR